MTGLVQGRVRQPTVTLADARPIRSKRTGRARLVPRFRKDDGACARARSPTHRHPCGREGPSEASARVVRAWFLASARMTALVQGPPRFRNGDGPLAEKIRSRRAESRMNRHVFEACMRTRLTHFAFRIFAASPREIFLFST